MNNSTTQAQTDNVSTSKSYNNGGVGITVTATGAGAMSKKGDTLEVKYTGKFLNGETFDSGTYPFVLGTGGVIEGWHLGMVDMQVGEKRTLVIPPNLAYGSQDYGPIPGNSTLTFDVELLSIK